MKKYYASCTCSLMLVAAVVAQTSQPSPCIRYAHPTTLGAASDNDDPYSTLYIYGGDARTATDQTTNTRTNALVSLDLRSNFSIASPPLRLVQADNGQPYSPPQTSLGALFSSPDGKSLYYYGGYFGDNPDVTPDPYRTFRYDLNGNSWNVQETGGDDILRAAGGGGAVVPENGSQKGFFASFGGHLDSYTVPGWSNQIDRLYLSSLLEYDLSTNSWENRTSYSSTSSVSQNSTAELAPLLRGDSTLTYVPGLGTNNQGLLISIGGGNLFQMSDNALLDVYDIGAQGWSKQATQGAIIGPRVSHCAVRGSAKVNGELKHQIFVYGGQPANRTTQIQQGPNGDLFVLSLPSFTWTKVDNIPSAPAGRAGHSCSLIGSQMLIIGGVVSEDLLCDQPGVYVLDTTSLSFSTTFAANSIYTTPDQEEIVALAGGRGTGSSTSGSGYAIGTGANDTDTSSQFGAPNGGTQPGGGSNSGGGGGGSNGGLIGGLVGGILGGLLLLGLLIFFWRRKRSRSAAAASEKASEKPLSGSQGTSPGSIAGNPYESASDDVEEQTQGYNAQFAHLVPRQTLRVVNA